MDRHNRVQAGLPGPDYKMLSGQLYLPFGRFLIISLAHVGLFLVVTRVVAVQGEALQSTREVAVGAGRMGRKSQRMCCGQIVD